MGVSLITNVLVYTQNVYFPVMYSIGLKTNICDPPNNPSDGLVVDYVWVYTRDGSWKNQDTVYIPIGSSQTINIMVSALFGSSPKLEDNMFTLF